MNYVKEAQFLIRCRGFGNDREDERVGDRDNSSIHTYIVSLRQSCRHWIVPKRMYWLRPKSDAPVTPVHCIIASLLVTRFAVAV